MQCRRAQEILSKADWRIDKLRDNRELIDHLESCRACASELRAEQDIMRAERSLVRTEPNREMSLQELRDRVEQDDRPKRWRQRLIHPRYRHYRVRGLAVSLMAAVLLVIALVPFSFRDKVGYEISISGVDRNVAIDSKGIVPLLDALGMEQDKADSLLNALERKEILLKVGECTETCHLRISDLKTEKDVQLIIKAIIELGCCEIDNVFPIYKDESTTLLGRVTRKLLS